MNLAVLTALCRQNTKLNGIERTSCISAGYICQKLQRILVDLCVKASHSLILIINRTFQQSANIFFPQRF